MSAKDFLLELLECSSVSGHEEAIAEIIKDHMEKEADEILTDEIGDTVCILNPHSSSRILLTAHCDEIGLMVSSITSKGQLTVIDRGGVIPQTYPGHGVRIAGKEKVLYGVVETTRDFLKKQDLKITDFLVDIGASSREEAASLVELGAPLVPDAGYREMTGSRFMGRALDDRLGVYIIMEALKEAKKGGCKAGVYAAATVGEETTKNGAYWTAARIKPELSVVVDVTYTSDCLGMNEAEAGRVLLGGGPVLCNSPIVIKKWNSKLKECADAAGIPYQIEAASRLSCTDADKIHFAGEGIPVVLVSIPLRYMHSPGEVADMEDVKNSVKLLSEFLIRYKP